MTISRIRNLPGILLLTGGLATAASAADLVHAKDGSGVYEQRPGAQFVCASGSQTEADDEVSAVHENISAGLIEEPGAPAGARGISFDVAMTWRYWHRTAGRPGTQGGTHGSTRRRV